MCTLSHSVRKWRKIYLSPFIVPRRGLRSQGHWPLRHFKGLESLKRHAKSEVFISHDSKAIANVIVDNKKDKNNTPPNIPLTFEPGDIKMQHGRIYIYMTHKALHCSTNNLDSLVTGAFHTIWWQYIVSFHVAVSYGNFTLILTATKQRKLPVL